MNNVPGKIKISYVLVEIVERPLNIPKRPSIENIGILHKYGPGVRGANAQRLLVQSENTRTFVRTSFFLLEILVKMFSISSIYLYSPECAGKSCVVVCT